MTLLTRDRTMDRCRFRVEAQLHSRNTASLLLCWLVRPLGLLEILGLLVEILLLLFG